jgi:DNA-binding response OmpR family regulator
MESVWGADHAVGASALDVLVNSLRTKIDAPYRNQVIGTVRGAGYIFKLSSAAPGRTAQ